MSRYPAHGGHADKVDWWRRILQLEVPPNDARSNRGFLGYCARFRYST